VPLTDRSRLRLVVLGVLVVSLLATLIGRLWYLQVLAAPTFQKLATSNQVRDIVTAAPRGEILDDQGRPLVDNKTALVITVDRAALNRQPDGGKAVLHRLSKVIGVPYAKLAIQTQYCTYPKVDGKYVAKPKGCWSGSPYEPIPVSEVTPSLAATRQAILIQEMQNRFHGVSAGLASVRHYPKPDGAKASAILGYVTPINAQQLAALPAHKQVLERSSEVGATGLEASYEKYLHGHEGVKQVTVDHVGRQTGVVRNVPPRAGDDVVTNIDAKVQAALETQLQDAINTARSHGYAADYSAGVVMNARTGGVIAMASNPTYEPNHAPPTLTKPQYDRLLHSPGSPLFDKAFQGASPPGSTFKMISSAGLIHDGQITTGGLYDCPTTFRGRHSFEGTPGLGPITLQHAIEVSCDTFFFKLGYEDYYRDYNLVAQHKKPREGVQHMARDLGLGENPGIDLPNAATGHIPDRLNTRLEWKANRANYCKGAARRPKGSYQQRVDQQYCDTGYIFEPGDQENVDVGQGTVTASPLQMAVAYSALANGGTVFEPRVAKAILSPSGKLIKRITAPVRGHIPLSRADLAYLRNAFYSVTTGSAGTARGAFAGFPMTQVLVGGKTGTAELPNSAHQNDSWFVSFGGPTGQKPQYVTVIEVDKSNQGAISAAPFVRNIWEELYGLGGHKALFPNGVPPKKLPKIGTAAMKTGSGSGHHASAVHHSATSVKPGGRSTPSATSASALQPGLPVSRWGPWIGPAG